MLSLVWHSMTCPGAFANAVRRFDPYNQHPDAPIDLDGHGTHVLGVMLAGDASGEQLGVTPDAKWIAARIHNDSGQGSTSAIHRIFQWVLDPDNDPVWP